MRPAIHFRHEICRYDTGVSVPTFWPRVSVTNRLGEVTRALYIEVTSQFQIGDATCVLQRGSLRPNESRTAGELRCLVCLSRRAHRDMTGFPRPRRYAMPPPLRARVWCMVANLGTATVPKRLGT